MFSMPFCKLQSSNLLFYFVSATIQDQKAFASAKSFGEFCLRHIIDSVLLWPVLSLFPSWFWSWIIRVTCKLTNDNKEIIV